MQPAPHLVKPEAVLLRRLAGEGAGHDDVQAAAQQVACHKGVCVCVCACVRVKGNAVFL